MSRPIVRRITSAVLLLSILCFALPAAAAPAGRAQTSKVVPVVLGSSLLDQVFSWLNSLWAGREPKPQVSREKVGTVLPEAGTGTAAATKQDHGGMIDPNGGW